MRIILLPVLDKAKSADPTKAALMLAKALGAHVEGLHLMEHADDEVQTLTGNLPDEVREVVSKALQDQFQESNRTARELFEGLCSAEGVEIFNEKPRQGICANWREMKGRPEFVIPIAGRMADMTVIGRPDQDKERMELFTEALFNTGRPVFLVPPGGSAELGSGPAVIAWNQSMEAAKALSASLPLLKQCTEAHLVSVGTEMPAGPTAQQMVRYLSWQGVNATAESFPAQRDVNEKRLFTYAKEVGASLLVMGAYSRSRWRQRILGGFTRMVIEEAEMSVFLQR